MSLVAAPVAAQITPEPGDFGVQRFDPETDRNGVLGVESGSLPRRGDIDATLRLNYARKLLVTVGDTASDQDVLGSLVRNRLDVHALVGWTALDRLKVFGGGRMTLFQDRDQTVRGVEGRLAQLEPTGGVELVAGAKVMVLEEDEHGVALALLPRLSVFTVDHNYFGESAPSGEAKVSASKTFGPVRVLANVGYLLRRDTRLINLVVGDEVRYGLAAAYRLPIPRHEIGLQAAVAGAVAVQTPPASNNTPVEARAGVRWAMSPELDLYAGVGTGFNRAFGNPSVRVLTGIGFAPRHEPAPPPAPPPATPQPVSVPVDLDSDDDGIPDGEDVAPLEPEDVDGYQDDDGAPDPDNDGDGVADAEDACPDDAGLADNKGCPDTDRDGDAVVDRLDACPNEAGAEDDSGCPREPVTIQLQVRFEGGQASLSPEAEAVLRDVAERLNGSDRRARIEGHADATGTPATNARVSRERAEAVMRFLVEAGVDASKLTAVGIGSARPVASNGTAEGRAQNRRTEIILE